LALNPVRLELGTSVRCTDSEFGELADLVIDPTTKRVTHLVVKPRQDSEPNRLVPIDLADPSGDREISLRCTVAEALEFESVQDFAYFRLGEFPVEDPDWDVGVEHVFALPYYEASNLGDFAVPYEDSIGMSFDRVPKGEVEIRRASTVSSADGEPVGHVDGLLVDNEGQVTHLVLEHGHLWRKRDVTIPIAAVSKVETDSVTVNLTTEQLGELPSVPVHRWSG
jgi:sporulation protein YlmC with PRC-barrel domain